MERAVEPTAEHFEDAVVPLDNLQPFPLTPGVARLRIRLIGNPDPEPAERIGAQRGTAAMHAEHDDKRGRSRRIAAPALGR